MKRALRDSTRWLRGRVGACVMLVMLAMTACRSVPVQNLELPAYYHPANVAVASPTLPASIKRVALLPLASVKGDQSLEQGVDALGPVVDSELKKTERFEVVNVSPAHLRELTGQSSWRADETLPIDFFRALQRDTGCDAVMFCEVTRYKPYQPLAIGWKLCLAAQGVGEKTDPRKLWSVDEVLDAGDTKIAQAARTYYTQHIHNEIIASDANTVTRSPAMFGQFSLSALFATLPVRER